MCVADNAVNFIEAINEIIFYLYRRFFAVAILSFQTEHVPAAVIIVRQPVTLCFKLIEFLIYLFCARDKVQHMLAGNGHSVVVHKKECSRARSYEPAVATADAVKRPCKLKNFFYR